MRPDVYPSDSLFRGDPPPLGDHAHCMLAEGDSWFTIGSMNFFAASNLLFMLELAQWTAIVNCAYPGDTMRHVVDRINDPYFDRFLRKPNFSRRWDAILLSVGGNDLIDAAQTPTINRAGTPIAPENRLLLTPAEAGQINPGVAGPARFVSEPAWQKLADYLSANFRELASRRDQGRSANRPICVHTYHVPVVRPSGAVTSPTGWLHPAMVEKDIPAEDRQGLADELFERLRTLLLGFDSATGSHPIAQFCVFDSARLVPLTPAQPDESGSSGDWVNEIHPTPAGYRKIGAAMGPWLDAVLALNP